jgi:hypothetical protein
MTLKGWVSHIDGAVALVKTRGKAQLNTDIGRALFDAIRSHMVCILFHEVEYVD